MELREPLGRLNKILLVSSLVLLSGCFSRERKIEISTEPVKVPVMQPVAVRAVKLEDVEFKVVTSENIDEFLKQWKKKYGDDFVFIAFSVKDYETMALNLEEIRRYINQQKEIIVYYRKVTSNEETKSDTSNTSTQ